ncbi:thrombospondin type 3 repeat-containing protein [Spongiibacter tropicus]|uniref:thrombospondin type 3 repeat-containing protein n=2 Tax=Spongiibacter tropicus TaxID=454602 RepID=UPI0024E1A582|nr:thrombospondin type 3 repeat-containing protein [Spongiibacter tropicus]
MHSTRRSAGRSAALSLMLSAALAACGGGGGGGSSSRSSSDLSGSPVKGPMANAVVQIFSVDGSAAQAKGDVLSTGSTNAQAAITGINIPASHSGALIVEITADDDTVDLASNAAPAVTVFRTLLSNRDAADAPIYPSPLTTLAYDLAVAKADSSSGGFSGNNDGSISEAELIAAFTIASAKVSSSLGFGLAAGTNLNTTPPLVTSATTTNASLAEVAAYRQAIEAVSAILVNMQDATQSSNASTTATTDSLLTALASDLSDGEVDGLANGDPIAEFADVGDVASQVNVDPSSLTIPGTDTLVSDVESILVSEQAATGVDTNSDALANGSASADPSPAQTTPDIDEDGIADNDDNCPNTANANQADFDNDGQGNACDNDDDNDGVNDNEDAFPRNPDETVDSDDDGVGDNGDNCPNTANADQLNSDDDSLGNACDNDDDGDGVDDVNDAFPLDPGEDTDTDGNGVGNNADPDDDGDGVNDGQDAFPFDPSESADSDSDGIGDNSDAFPNDPSETLDSDNDGVGDNSDAFPNDPNESSDADSDGVGDNADNCPNNANADQADDDNDGIGDVCDSPDGAVWDNFNWDEANWQ